MHSEYYSINEEANYSKFCKKRWKNIAVEYHKLQSLRTVGNEKGYIEPKEGYTDILFIGI